jgi:hypothetical protein
MSAKISPAPSSPSPATTTQETAPVAAQTASGVERQKQIKNIAFLAFGLFLLFAGSLAFAGHLSGFNFSAESATSLIGSGIFCLTTSHNTENFTKKIPFEFNFNGVKIKI